MADDTSGLERPSFYEGQRVRIVKGQLAGLDGTVEDATPGRNWILRLDGLPAAVRVILSGDSLESLQWHGGGGPR